MKLDELSKTLYKEINFDNILDPDLNEMEKENYYQNILKDARVEKNEEKEDKIVAILRSIISNGEDNE